MRSRTARRSLGEGSAAVAYCSRQRSDLELAVSVHRVPEVQALRDCIHDRSARPPRRSQDAGHVDVLIVAPGFRHRWRVPPARPVPRPNLRHPGRPGQPRRDLVDPSVPGGALGQRTCSLRLRFKPWRGPSIEAGERSSPTSARSLTSTPSTQYIRYQHRVTSASWSTRTAGGTVESRGATPGSGCGFTHRLPVDVQGYYNHAQALPARVDGMDRFQGLVVPPPGGGRGPRPRGQARRGDRARAATAATLIPDSRESSARDDAAALPHLLLRTTHDARARRDARPAGPPDEWMHEIMRRQYITQYHWLARARSKRPTSARVPHGVHAPAAARGLRHR